MSIELAVGERYRSVVCATEVIVLKAPEHPVDLGCGGALLVPVDAEAEGGELDAQLADGTQIGKRYSDASDTVEVLCTKSGEGTLTLDGTPLEIKSAASLPASD